MIMACVKTISIGECEKQQKLQQNVGEGTFNPSIEKIGKAIEGVPTLLGSSK